jgi:hypothetical protein
MGVGWTPFPASASSVIRVMVETMMNTNNSQASGR